MGIDISNFRVVLEDDLNFRIEAVMLITGWIYSEWCGSLRQKKLGCCSADDVIRGSTHHQSLGMLSPLTL